MMSMQAQLAVWALFGIGAAAFIVIAARDLEVFRRLPGAHAPSPVGKAENDSLAEAMREVDALTPSCPPIAPPEEIAAVGSSWLNVRTNRWITDLHAPPLPPPPTRAPGPGQPMSR